MYVEVTEWIQKTRQALAEFDRAFWVETGLWEKSFTKGREVGLCLLMGRLTHAWGLWLVVM